MCYDKSTGAIVIILDHQQSIRIKKHIMSFTVVSHDEVPISEEFSFVGNSLHFNQKLPHELESESQLWNKTPRKPYIPMQSPKTQNSSSKCSGCHGRLRELQREIDNKYDTVHAPVLSRELTVVTHAHLQETY